MWAYAFRAPLGAFNFCEKPIFTLKTTNRQIFVVCYGFFLLSVCFFMQIIWQWMQQGDSENVGSTFRNSTAGLLRAS